MASPPPPKARRLTLILVVVASMAFMTPTTANHPQTVATETVAFDHIVGNEWWVEVALSGPTGSISNVEAQDGNDAWVPLTLRSWGPYAASFHIEPGHQVRFHASVDAVVITSCYFTHPAGIEQGCDTVVPPSNGTVGPPGPAGPMGPAGPAGVNGTDGADGADGADGQDGADGSNGTDGADGADGTNGVNGTNGANGADGADGTNGVNGTNGANGADGADGTNGVNGTNGADGADGATGATGAAGVNGTNGANGAPGATGATGPAGANGTNGATGPAGPAGSTLVAGTVGASTQRTVGLTATSVANCAPGKVLLGGGATMTATGIAGNLQRIALLSSYPSDVDTWTVTAIINVELAGGGDRLNVQAFALCSL